MVAYSWDKPGQDAASVIPLYWLKASELDEIGQFAADAKAATEKMPEGHRAMFSWDLHRILVGRVNGDFLYTSRGDVAGCNSEQGFRPYRSLWLENGVARTRLLFERFFKAYTEAGGKLDVFVLDFEQGFSYWHLANLAEAQYSCGLDAYLDAIENDPRFSDWIPELGFSDLQTLHRWYENEDHLKWSALVWRHLAEYINTAVYEPMREYFPDAEFSNYGYYYQLTDFDLPDIHGFYRHRYSAGVHVGTHQSRELYGWVDLPPGARFNGIEYPSTPFNAFRFALNKLRAMLVSSTVPVSPWVAYKGFTESHLNNNDYYQELVFHTLLSGVDYLLYWNPSAQADFSPDDDLLLARLLAQVNQLIAGRQVSYMSRELVNWLDDTVITKIHFNDESELWRLTVNLEQGGTVDSLVEQESPARLRIGETVYDFKGMRVMAIEEPLSNKGLWIVSD